MKSIYNIESRKIREYRKMRGTGWYERGDEVRVAFRYSESVKWNNKDLGFRFVILSERLVNRCK